MLHLKNLKLNVGGALLFDAFELQISGGQVLTLMGPSGSGKSSLLSWMVGEELPATQADGELRLNHRRIDKLPTEQRRVGILFQDDLLFAHLSVGQNLAFALPERVKGRQRRLEVVENALADMDMAGFQDRDPATLSGGQRARVSLMRALLAEPEALLLDEPFSRLDATLRSAFRELVYRRIAKLNIPALLVTHDPADVPPNGEVLHIGPEAPGNNSPKDHRRV